jgi:hypothetical protein
VLVSQGPGPEFDSLPGNKQTKILLGMALSVRVLVKYIPGPGFNPQKSKKKKKKNNNKRKTTWKAQIGRIAVQCQPGKILRESPSPKYPE